MLKGRLRGNAVGLVQIFRESTCPPLVARALLIRVLEDFHETGHHYLLHLARSREDAHVNGTDDQVDALDTEIREHRIHLQIPERWQLDFFFSLAGYRRLGDGLLAFWAVVLTQIVTLEQVWEDILLGLEPTCLYLLPGFHPEREVFSTDWLEDFRPIWAAGIRAVDAEHDVEQDDVEQDDALITNTETPHRARPTIH